MSAPEIAAIYARKSNEQEGAHGERRQGAEQGPQFETPAREAAREEEQRAGKRRHEGEAEQGNGEDHSRHLPRRGPRPRRSSPRARPGRR
jgi:hypothetical protein